MSCVTNVILSKSFAVQSQNLKVFSEFICKIEIRQVYISSWAGVKRGRFLRFYLLKWVVIHQEKAWQKKCLVTFCSITLLSRSRSDTLVNCAKKSVNFRHGEARTKKVCLHLVASTLHASRSYEEQKQWSPKR